MTFQVFLYKTGFKTGCYKCLS